MNLRLGLTWTRLCIRGQHVPYSGSARITLGLTSTEFGCVSLYQRSLFKTGSDEPIFSRTKLGVAACDLPRIREGYFFFFPLVTGHRRFLSLRLSDERVYEPQIRARLGITAHFCSVDSDAQPRIPEVESVPAVGSD